MRRYPSDMPLRFLRLALAVWLLVGPALLGFWGTFPQRQDSVLGLMLVPAMALGFLVPGLRVLLIVAGAWLVMSPSFSGEYPASDTMVWHDRIAGLAALFLGFLPLGVVDEYRAEPAVVQRSPLPHPVIDRKSTFGNIDRRSIFAWRKKPV